MFRGILQGFVQHPKETECDLLRQGLRDGFALKVNPYCSALRELLQKALAAESRPK
jgi:hypothetical protein